MIVYNKGDKVTPRNAIFKSPVFTVDDIQDGGMFTVEEMPGIPLYARDFDRLINQSQRVNISPGDTFTEQGLAEVRKIDFSISAVPEDALLTPARIRADAITAETIAAASAPEFKKGDRVVERNAIKGLNPRYFTVSFVHGDTLEFTTVPGTFFKASDFVRVDEAPPTAKNLFDEMVKKFSEPISNGLYSRKDNPEFKEGDCVVFKDKPGPVHTVSHVTYSSGPVGSAELHVELEHRSGELFKASRFKLHEPSAEKLSKNSEYGRAERKINGINRNDVESFKEVSQRVGVNMLDLYQTIATKSAIYPGHGTPLGLAYVALKLNGEAGEFAEHVGKAMRDDALVKPISEDGCEQLCAPSGFIAGELMPERHASLLKEAGDVLWYLSAICNELGTTLSAVARTNLEKLCDRNERNALQCSGDNR